jgi:chromate reductase, NAD(P)H dehydrogenase (quinone)
MITIISGTNRKGSNTEKIALAYQLILRERGIEAKILSLLGVELAERNADFERIEAETLIPTTTFIIISPEYNGSFSGALKLFFDTSRVHLCWWHKSALLVGVATGRAGNLRGMEHLTGILNHMKVMVHFNKLPISSVDKLLDGDGRLVNELTIMAINHQLNEFFGVDKK